MRERCGNRAGLTRTQGVSRRGVLFLCATMDPLRGHPASRLPTPADVTGVRQGSGAVSPAADVGHVNLRVQDLDRSTRFYRDVLGFHVTQRDARSVFLAAGDYHHHVALNTWD